MKMNTMQAVLAAAIGALCSYFLKLMIPLAVLFFAMVLDYCTGVGGAWARGELSSRTGLKGIVKKVGYLVVVATAGVVDWLLMYGLATAGIEARLPFLFAGAVTVWLIINELISILENVAELGVPVPGFVLRLLARLKGVVEDKGDAAVDELPEGHDGDD